jgi:hypothetical protein
MQNGRRMTAGLSVPGSLRIPGIEHFACLGEHAKGIGVAVSIAIDGPWGQDVRGVTAVSRDPSFYTVSEEAMTTFRSPHQDGA